MTNPLMTATTMPVHPNSAKEIRNASLYVAERARDADDARELLSALGLLGSVSIPQACIRRYAAGDRVIDIAADYGIDTATVTRYARLAGIGPRQRAQAACGTNGGYHRHRDHHEPACDPCKAAHSAAEAKRKARATARNHSAA